MKNLALLRFLPFGLLLFRLVQPTVDRQPAPVSGPAVATELCGQHHLHQSALANDPVYQQKQAAFEDAAYEFFKKQKPQGEQKSVLYTLPLVIHIIHDDGPENITDAQVLQGIQDLNDAFANVGYYDPATGVDTEIQFCLAKQDPDGNLTTGINRVQSPLTVVTAATDVEMKDLSRWDPLHYINIWLVRNANGYAGYAYLPGAHGAPFDGIVEDATVFGSSFENSSITAHEMGHYLGLLHTWDGGCQNDDCLTDGDQVCDTPPDQSTAGVPCGGTMNTCTTDTNSGFTTDQEDMYWNYMDYASTACYTAFTQGQADRMIFTIENIRNSLLDSEACNDPCTSNITASFLASPMPVFAGQTVVFTNTSTNATSYDWHLDGNSFSTLTSPNLLFNEPGEFEIILFSYNADPNCVATDTLIIEVACPVVADFATGGLFPPLGETVAFINNSTGTTSFEWTVNGVVEGTASNFNFTFDISGSYTVCLTALGPLCNDTECATLLVFDDSLGCESTFIKTFGTGNAEEAGYVVAESDNGGFFLAGGRGEQTVLMKIDPTGTVAWSRQFDLCPQDDFIEWLELDSEGYLVGSGYSKTGPLSDGPNFVFRYDHLNDQFQWVRNLDWPNTSRFLNMLENGTNGNFFVFGQVANLSGAGCDGIFIEVERNTGAPVWMKRYNLGACETFARSLIADGDVIVAGRYNFYTGQTYHLRGAMSRLDFSGNEIWSRTYLVPTNAGGADFYINGLVEDNSSLVCAAHGDVNTPGPEFTAQLFATDLDGEVLWAKYFDLPGEEEVADLLNLPDGYLIAGNFTSSSLGGQVFLVKTDKLGNLLWARQYGGSGDQAVADVLLDENIIQFIGSNGTGNAGSFLFARLDGEGQTLDPCDLIADLSVQMLDFPNPNDSPKTLVINDESYDLYPHTAPVSGVLMEDGFLCGSVCAEVCNNGVDDEGDGYVDCYDTDCDCNFDDCLVNDVEQNFAMKLAWESATDEVSTGATPIVANLNPWESDVAEIIVAVSGSNAQTSSPNLLIFNGDGSNASNPDVLPIPGGYDAYPPVSPAIGDLDRDGIPELVMVSSDKKVLVFTNFIAGATPPMQALATSVDLVENANVKPMLADFNRDGISEIYLGSNIYKIDLTASPPGLTKVLNPGSFGGIFSYNNYQEPSSSPVAVDILEPAECNGDPDCNGLELVAGNFIFSIDLQTNDGDGFEMEFAADLNLLQSQFGYNDGYTAVADVDLDGLLDVVVSSSRDNVPGVYVWNKNGPLAWLPHPVNSSNSGGLPCIANVYDDTQNGATVDFPEILVTCENRLICYNLNPAASGQTANAWWVLNVPDASGATSVTAFDFDGNGLDEIVFRDENNLRIMYGGSAPFPAGVDAQRNWQTAVCGSNTFDEHPVVADVDDNGQAEIVVTGRLSAGPNASANDFRGRLRVFEADPAAGQPWMSARPVWNQFNYFAVNVNDDLSMPLEQQLHHVEFPQTGSNYRPLNRFLGQSPLLDNDLLPYLPVPDATITLDSATCNADSILVSLTVCNEGSAPLPAGTPVAFYLADPTAMAAALHHVIFLSEKIDPDSCLSLSANVPTANGDFYMVVNDDGSLPTPFSLADDFPSTNQPECNYENNIAAFFYEYVPPAPPDLGPDTSFCINGVFTLDAGPGWATYYWQDGSFNQTFSGFMPGTYWVQVMDDCGVVFTDTIQITEDTGAQFSIGADTTICPGQPLVFDVPGWAVYQWLPADYLDCDTCASVTATPLFSTTYALIATDADGCVSVDSITVTTAGPIPVFDTLTICAGDSAFIFGSYETQAGDYLGFIVNPTGCDTAVLVTLRVNPGILLDILTENACEGQENGSATATATNANEPITWLWSNGGNGPYIENLPPGEYAISLTDTFGCQATAVATVEETPFTIVEMTVEDASCFGFADGSLALSGFEPGSLFSLDGQVFTQNIVFENLPADSYVLYVQEPGGCIFENNFTLQEPPQIQLTMPGDMAIELGDSILLSPQVSIFDSLDFEWSPVEGLHCLACRQTWAAPFETTVYTFTVSDAGGCAVSGSMELRVLRVLNVYVPNGFSPNGDGINDQFTVFAGTGVRQIRSLHVFDRWGGEVFENYNFPPNDPSIGWDGSFKGEAVNPAVFTWFAEVELVDGAVELVAGDVVVVR